MDSLLAEPSEHSWQYPTSPWGPMQQPGWVEAPESLELSLDQAAPLLVGVEIPVLSARRIRHRSDLRDLAIQYPCRIRIPGSADAELTVSNRIDAIAACHTLLSRKVNGAFPEHLLIEVDYSHERQLSLAMVAHEQSSEEATEEVTEVSGVTLWGAAAARAGGQAASQGAAVKQVKLPDGFSMEGGKDLARQLDVTEGHVAAIAALLEKLDILMAWAGLAACHLDAVALGAEGEIMPLRGRLVFTADSPWRRQAQAAAWSGAAIHPAIVAHPDRQAVVLAEEPRALTLELARDETGTETGGQAAEQAHLSHLAHPGEPRKTVEKLSKAWPQLFASPRVIRLGEGNIALIGNHFHSTMATLEQCRQQGGAVAAFVNLAASLQCEGSLEPGAWADGDLPGLLKSAPAVNPAVAHAQSRAGSILQPLPPMTGPMERFCDSQGKDLTEDLDIFTLRRQLAQAIRTLSRLREVKVVLINWHSLQLPCRVLTDAVGDYQNQAAQQVRRLAQPISLVVRWADANAETEQQRVMGEDVEVAQNLDVAIARSLSLARMARG